MRAFHLGVELRVWVGIWVTLPELAVVSSGWLQFERGVETLIALGTSLVAAVQCGRAEWRYLKGHSRETRWRLVPHLPVVVSILVFVADGVRLRCAARLGNARVATHVDVGFGDVVTTGAHLSRRRSPRARP
jgi:hypothetical protein